MPYVKYNSSFPARPPFSLLRRAINQIIMRPMIDNPTHPDSPREHLQRAIDIFGNQTKLAEAIGVTQPAISAAIKAGSVSTTLAVLIDRATGGRVKSADLCPEVFGYVALK